ncbi:hypothetical protein CWI39_0017p0050 [Hamiltosporidium magnivora]|uniref:Uncharacterized protein n=1 Tax=Hamiltosporidium magnivora TaxID=148818 RepID=A0A4Q9LND0_9MICR|nr:hypothetical protein CWI39_0017p0050 [Hamiltosporidium magnivora]
MNVCIALILHNILCLRVSESQNTVESANKMINLLNERIYRLEYPISANSDENKSFSITITNNFQDTIEDISLAIPLVKILFQTHINRLKSLLKNCLILSIEKQIKFIDCLGDENLRNIKIIYRSLFLMFIDIFVARFIAFWNVQTFLKENEILERLDAIKTREINEKELVTQDEKIKIILDSIHDEAFLSFLYDEVTITFKGVFIVLNEKFPELSIYDSNKNKEFWSAVIENNQFVKAIKKIYSLNNWKCPCYYDSAILQTQIEYKKLCYDCLIFMFANFGLVDKTPGSEQPKTFSWIIDFDDIHTPLMIIDDLMCVFPKRYPDYFRNSINFLFFKLSSRSLNLTFKLNIEEWLTVFIKQLCLKLERVMFFHVLKQNFSEIEKERQRQLSETFKEITNLTPFCDEIKTFFVTLKNEIRSSTYVCFYLHSVCDSVFRFIFTKFINENGFDHEILQEDGTDAIPIVQKNILLFFSYFFKSALTEYFKTEGFIKKKRIIWE